MPSDAFMAAFFVVENDTIQLTVMSHEFPVSLMHEAVHRLHQGCKPDGLCNINLLLISIYFGGKMSEEIKRNLDATQQQKLPWMICLWTILGGPHLMIDECEGGFPDKSRNMAIAALEHNLTTTIGNLENEQRT